MKKTVYIFAALIAALLALFQLGKYSYFSGVTWVDVVFAIIAIVFFIIGWFIQKQRRNSSPPKSYEIDLRKIKELGISAREYEVLSKIAEGLSNQEIAAILFVTESTIKTHVSNLLLKLNAKRRTQAVEIAKRLQII